MPNPNEIVRRFTSVELWAYGLLSGAISGGATAAVSTASLAIANASGVDVPVLNFKSIALVFVSSAMTTALGYLSKSPLPAIVSETTTTTTLTVNEKTVAPDPTNTPKP